MVYADYEWYTQQYFGNILTEQDFPKYAKKASAEIDHVTFGRIAALPEDQILDMVRDATCDVAERLYYFDTVAEGGAIVSENNDDYSVSYRDIGSKVAQQEEIQTTIRTYLANTGLMYRGVTHHDLC